MYHYNLMKFDETLTSVVLEESFKNGPAMDALPEDRFQEKVATGFSEQKEKMGPL